LQPSAHNSWCFKAGAPKIASHQRSLLPTGE
jgi:hypothetical protein